VNGVTGNQLKTMMASVYAQEIWILGYIIVLHLVKQMLVAPGVFMTNQAWHHLISIRPIIPVIPILSMSSLDFSIAPFKPVEYRLSMTLSTVQLNAWRSMKILTISMQKRNMLITVQWLMVQTEHAKLPTKTPVQELV
jgi:hypothetical protein